jgi:glycosidase
MRNGKIKHRDIKDPFGKQYWPFFTGRDKARTPMQWDSSKGGGFTNGIPWLPVNEDFQVRNVEVQENDPTSLLNFYRRLIKIRKEHPALQLGRWVPLITGQRGIIAYARIHATERIIIILNFTGRKKLLVLPEHSFGYVVMSTHRKPKEIYYFQDLRIFPYEATVYSAEYNSA